MSSRKLGNETLTEICVRTVKYAVSHTVPVSLLFEYSVALATKENLQSQRSMLHGVTSRLTSITSIFFPCWCYLKDVLLHVPVRIHSFSHYFSTICTGKLMISDHFLVHRMHLSVFSPRIVEHHCQIPLPVMTTRTQITVLSSSSNQILLSLAKSNTVWHGDIVSNLRPRFWNFLSYKTEMQTISI